MSQQRILNSSSMEVNRGGLGISVIIERTFARHHLSPCESGTGMGPSLQLEGFDASSGGINKREA